MKLPLRPRLIKLNNRGVAHYILPLAVLMVVGVAGVYSLVSSSANDLSTATTAVNKKAPDTKKKDTSPKGYMLLYSQQGKYDRAYIITGYADGTNQPVNEDKSTCSNKKPKKLANGYRGWVFKLSDSKKGSVSTKIRCSSSNYDVFFLKKGENIKKYDIHNTSMYAAVGLQTNYCSFVHKKGVTRVEAIDSKGSCVGDNDPNEDTIDKTTPVMTYGFKPSTIVKNKKYVFIITLKDSDNSALSPEECAGSVTAKEHRSGKGDSDKYTELPLRYNAKTKSCLYKYNGKGDEDFKVGTFTETAKFSGNKFLNPTEAKATYTFKK